ncbi:MAG: hypothetical protein WCE30_16290 [Mycobacterium sp.]
MKRRIAPIAAFLVLPAISLMLALGAGYLKWTCATTAAAQRAGIDAMHAASTGAVAMLSYRPQTVDADLASAREHLTGILKESYGALTHDVVAKGAKEQRISATATVPATAVVSATQNSAVILVFVDQTVTVGNDAPTDTVSRVRVTLTNSESRWLISGFDPI